MPISLDSPSTALPSELLQTHGLPCIRLLLVLSEPSCFGELPTANLMLPSIPFPFPPTFHPLLPRPLLPSLLIWQLSAGP